MDAKQKLQHVGIYGLIEDDDHILVINKSKGPYEGLFDLPGGRPAHGEPLLQALRREIKEETGLNVERFSFVGNFSYLVPYENSSNVQIELYHIALVYRVNFFDLDDFNSSIADEDVEGSLWMNRQAISKENSSPLLWSVSLL